MWILWHHFISLGECSHRSISSNDSHTGENPPPCSITHHTLSWPPFAPVTAFKPIYPAVFALFFLRSQVPSLIPTPATSYEWLEFTGHGRSYHCSSRACRSCLLSRRRMDSFVNFDTIQVPCVADPGRLKTLSRFFGMHIAPSDYILYGVVVIVPGTCIVPYMMQIPQQDYSQVHIGTSLSRKIEHISRAHYRSKLILILRAKHQLDLRCTQGTDFPSI